MQDAILKPLQQFRQVLYWMIPKRRDSTMDLLDALSSNVQANSVVRLSLNGLFRRTYNSVRDAIQNFFIETSSKSNPMEQWCAKPSSTPKTGVH